MKKFMFSAVALIAFSFAGMANTGGEEKLEMKKLILEIDCDKVAKDVWWAWWGNGASAAVADVKKAEAKKACEDDKKKNTSIEAN